MKVIELIQGTPEWHAHRAQHFNASDAPAMLAESTNHTRADLIRELAAGVPREFSDFVQERVIDPGHQYEGLARAIAESIIGEDLYPVTGAQGKYSASFDGLTLLEDIAWEHKRLNQALRDAMFDGCTGADLPLMYQVQMEHQAMVSGCDKILFMASEWKRVDGEWELVEELHCWYTPKPELRARIVTGWAQLQADLADFSPAAPVAPETTGRAPDQMPALRIEVTGMVTASNLAEWKGQAIAVFQGISRELVTDQDFADADKTVKWCADIEDQLKGAKQHALSQTESIDLLFRTIDEISAQARETRLALDKLVTKRKEERRTEIGNNARRAVQDHVRAINETLGEHGLPMPATLIADLQAAMKGKRSFASMQDAVDAVATNAKITASQAGDRIRANMAILAEHPEHATLFADRVNLCASKSPEDLRNLVAARIGQHEKAEEDRRERERAKMREEEAEKARKALEERQARDAAAAAPATPVAVEEPTPAPTARPAPVLVRSPQSSPASPAPREVVKIKLGDINARIAPLTISADGLVKLGFNALPEKGAAKLYDQAQFVDICNALSAAALQAGNEWLKRAA
ncbi:YqaJ viral recombinase family protein [Stenotrophomonas bentonitica]|uniref:YqaJ viral recombinase family protein n=1 Tax=Stenotrophomonas bentonitica TaxID=1450134 RepID=UPI00345EC0D9